MSVVITEPTSARLPALPLRQSGDRAGRTLYVSSSEGKNTNDGLSPDAPLESLAKALSLLRDQSGDAVLLRGGDVFSEPLGRWARSGRSPSAPLVVGGYGRDERPRLIVHGTALDLAPSTPGGELHDLAFVGLHVLAAGREDVRGGPAGCSIGVHARGPVRGLLLDDCRIEGFATNVLVDRAADVTLRRCVIADAGANDAVTRTRCGGGDERLSGQGLLAVACDGLLVEQCVFDHNGHGTLPPGSAARFHRHNLFAAEATRCVVVRGCVIARAASHGVQLRGGGRVEDCLLIDNAVGCALGGAAGVFARNVVLGGRDISPSLPRGRGLSVGCGDAVVADNVFAHKRQTHGYAVGLERRPWTPAGAAAALIRGNVVFDFQGNGLEVLSDWGGVEFAGNDLQAVPPGRKLVTLETTVRGFRAAGNRYHADEGDPGRWFRLGGANLSFDGWRQATGDGSLVEQVDYPEHCRALPDRYLADARTRRVGSWEPALSAESMGAFFRAGFGR